MHDNNATVLSNVCKLTKQLLRLGVRVACAIPAQTCTGVGMFSASLTAGLVPAFIYIDHLCHVVS